MTLKTTPIAALLGMSVLLAACSAPRVADTSIYRVTGHYSSVGPAGQVKAYVYADKTVIELDGPATAARTTDRNGIDYPNTIEGRFVRLEGIVPEVRVRVGDKAMYFTLDPAAKVYSARGIAMTDMILKLVDEDHYP